MAAFTLMQSEADSGIFLVVGPDGLLVSTINEFLLHLSHCGRSAYTLRSYARSLAHFFGWLHTTGRPVDDVTPQAVEAYIALFSTETKGGACPVDPHKAGQINLRIRISAPSVHRQHRLRVLKTAPAYLTCTVPLMAPVKQLYGQTAWCVTLVLCICDGLVRMRGQHVTDL